MTSEVDGAEPLDAKINSVAHEGGEIKKGSAVYLQVNKLDTDAQPKVELDGRDKGQGRKHTNRWDTSQRSTTVCPPC